MWGQGEMQRGASRRSSTRSTGMMTGSIWETRMRLDEVKGGIKVFTEEESRDGDEDIAGLRVYNLRLRRNQSDGGGDRRKRKNWSPPEGGSVGAADSSSSPLRKIQSLNSSKIREEMAVEGSLSNSSEAEEIEIELEKGRKSFDDKEMDLAGKKVDQICDRSISLKESSGKITDTAGEKQFVDLEIEASSPATEASSGVVPPPASPLPMAVDLAPKKSPLRAVETRTSEVDDGFHEAMTEAQYRMQSIVDLVMWREIPRSAFVFGIGSFLLLSSSYTRDLNFSLVSAVSYFGLLYLAAIFFFNSILRRGIADSDEKGRSCLLGDEDAIRLVRLLLPYVNELIVNLRALFSGDPATTMKLAVILFVLARCGGTITCWTMAKMTFFGAFTIPKICASYSVQLGRFGKFWLERVKDAWDSCQHKKAVAAGVFTLIWNLSSAVARMWAVFMLLVAVRLYQQSAAAPEVAEEDSAGGDEAAAAAERPRRCGGDPEESRFLGGKGGGDTGSRLDGGVQVKPRRQYGGPGLGRTATREKKRWS